MKRKTYLQRKSSGICVSCGKNKSHNNTVLCLSCKRRNAGTQRKRLSELYRQKECRTCYKAMPTHSQFRQCKQCRNERKDEREASYWGRVLANLCADCESPVQDKVRCDSCLEDRAMEARNRRESLIEQKRCVQCAEYFTSYMEYKTCDRCRTKLAKNRHFNKYVYGQQQITSDLGDE